MSRKQPNFTIIKESGRTEFFTDRDYFGILSSIYHEYMSAGSNWDRPNMLLMDGKIVISEKLSEIAWSYGQRNRDLHSKLTETMRNEFTPDWMEPKP